MVVVTIIGVRVVVVLIGIAAARAAPVEDGEKNGGLCVPRLKHHRRSTVPDTEMWLPLSGIQPSCGSSGAVVVRSVGVRLVVVVVGPRQHAPHPRRIAW